MATAADTTCLLCMFDTAVYTFHTCCNKTNEMKICTACLKRLGAELVLDANSPERPFDSYALQCPFCRQVCIEFLDSKGVRLKMEEIIDIQLIFIVRSLTHQRANREADQLLEESVEQRMQLIDELERMNHQLQARDALLRTRVLAPFLRILGRFQTTNDEDSIEPDAYFP